MRSSFIVIVSFLCSCSGSSQNTESEQPVEVQVSEPALVTGGPCRDPGTHSSAKSMSYARSGHTAALLPDGRFLLVGGTKNADAVEEMGAIVIDILGDLDGIGFGKLKRRTGHTSTTLESGKVLVLGGSDGRRAYGPMIFDPATGRLDNISFKSTKAQLKAGLRKNHTATALGDGRVLVAGGWIKGNVGDAVFITADFEEQPAGTMIEARSLHTTTILDEGRVLVVGGLDEEPLASVETCTTRPPGPAWKAAESLPGPRLDHTATRLADGKVLIVGGRASQDEGAAVEEAVMVFEPEAGAWQEAGRLVTARYGHTATMLDDGRVVVIGGRGADGKALSSVEIYWPLAQGFCVAAPMDTARSRHTVTLLESGTLLVLGGSNDEIEALDTGVIFQPGRGHGSLVQAQ